MVIYEPFQKSGITPVDTPLSPSSELEGTPLKTANLKQVQWRLEHVIDLQGLDVKCISWNMFGMYGWNRTVRGHNLH